MKHSPGPWTLTIVAGGSYGHSFEAKGLPGIPLSRETLLYDAQEEMLALLRGCQANDCPIAPGPLRWVCQCREKIAALLARIDRAG